uniref:Uncharacterized protein n=1 Tax=Meloidogyne incognita TaxID=6306 RepID=A0A914NMM0_MELIC
MLVQQYSVHPGTKRTTLQSTDCWLQQSDFTKSTNSNMAYELKEANPAASISWLNCRARFLLS